MRMLELSSSVLYGRMLPSLLWTTKNQVRFLHFGIVFVRVELSIFNVHLHLRIYKDHRPRMQKKSEIV